MRTDDSSDSIPHSVVEGKVSTRSAVAELPSLRLREVDERLATDAQVSRAYARKVALVNAEIERLGWGKFNWWLFAQVAYGWAADNMVLECLTLSLTQVEMEMRPQHVQFASVFFYLGTFVSVPPRPPCPLPLVASGEKLTMHDRSAQHFGALHRTSLGAG